MEILSLMAKEAAKTETGKENSIAAKCREGRAAETESFKEEVAKKQMEEANIEETGRDKGSEYRGRAIITAGNTETERQKQQR